MTDSSICSSLLLISHDKFKLYINELFPHTTYLYNCRSIFGSSSVSQFKIYQLNRHKNRIFKNTTVKPVTTSFLFPPKSCKLILKEYFTKSIGTEVKLLKFLSGKMITRYQFPCFLTLGNAFSGISVALKPNALFVGLL